jgi:hypothetical protein
LFYGKYNRKLVKDTIPLISSVDRDEFIMASETAFDCTFDGTSKFYPWKMPTELPKSFKLELLLEVLVVVNQRYLKNFGIEENPEWLSNKSIISHFETPDIGINKLMAVGLNSIPSWYKPYNVI